ncbi:hypothetical protein KCU88_g1627, partial [Aureobasidium melanogenum]
MINSVPRAGSQIAETSPLTIAARTPPDITDAPQGKIHERLAALLPSAMPAAHEYTKGFINIPQFDSDSDGESGEEVGHHWPALVHARSH